MAKNVAERRNVAEASRKLAGGQNAHPRLWERLGKDKIAALNKGQAPKVLAVGPRMIGGITKRYAQEKGFSGEPGEVFEVTAKNDGTLDEIALGSAYYAIKHLKVERVDVWAPGPSFDYTLTSLDSVVDISGLSHNIIRGESVAYDISGADGVIVGCSDSRVQVHDIYEDVIVVSNAGNILSLTALEVISEAVQEGVPIVSILGHTKCGAVGAAVDKVDESQLGGIVSLIGQNLRAGDVSDAEVQNAISGAKILRTDPGTAGVGGKLREVMELLKDAGTHVKAQFLDFADGSVKDVF